MASAAEPRVEQTPVPIWLIVLLFLLLFLSMVYFDQHGAWFDQRVYTPYHSFAQVVDMWPKDDEKRFLAYGQKVFSQQCAICHMETGVGNPANNCPPLVGSEWITTPGPGRLVRIISNAPIGPIEVNGKVYNGTMVAVGNQLEGDERKKSESIAAIVSYVRKTFGNIPKLATTEQVLAIRAQIANHTGSFTAQELKAVPDTE